MWIEVGGGGSALQIILWEAWEWKGRPPATESLWDAFPGNSIQTIKSAHTMQIFTRHFQSTSSKGRAVGYSAGDQPSWAAMQ